MVNIVVTPKKPLWYQVPLTWRAVPFSTEYSYQQYFASPEKRKEAMLATGAVIAAIIIIKVVKK